MLGGRGQSFDFRDPWGNRFQVVGYRNIQFERTDGVRRKLGIESVEKTDAAKGEIAERGLSVTIYHEGSRELQDRFDSRRIADRLEEVNVSRTFTDYQRELIDAAPMFWLATADADGWPDVSYKGGMPGFVRVVGESEIAFPNYDGNGMYKSLGNVLVNPRVGLLFIRWTDGRGASASRARRRCTTTTRCSRSGRGRSSSSASRRSGSSSTARATCTAWSSPSTPSTRRAPGTRRPCRTGSCGPEYRDAAPEARPRRAREAGLLERERPVLADEVVAEARCASSSTSANPARS